jgi:hypothetical protein
MKRRTFARFLSLATMAAHHQADVVDWFEVGVWHESYVGGVYFYMDNNPSEAESVRLVGMRS